MRTNWAGNVAYGAARLHRPSSLAELQRVVGSARRVRALGTGHSFNRLADSAGDQVSVAGLPPNLEVDAERSTVRVSAGMRYGEVAERLHANGLALHNLGSLPHISLAGACATATHGSGVGNGNLATAVLALEMVTATGDLVTLSREADADLFCGAVVSLGALGVVTALTLAVEPTYDVAQHVYDDLPRDQLDEHFAEVVSAGYSVSLFTDWRGPLVNQVWLKRRVGGDTWTPPPRWLGATLAERPRHPLPAQPPQRCTEQLGVAGAWHERLPHFRLDFVPGSGAELQSEYLLPREHAVPALDAVGRVAALVTPALQVCEIRTVAADDLWLSPSYRRDCVAIHFTWRPDLSAVTPALAAVEEQLAPFAARPHWAKLFGLGPEVVSGLYERLPDFGRLRRDLDPTGTFGNDLVDRYAPSA